MLRDQPESTMQFTAAQLGPFIEGIDDKTVVTVIRNKEHFDVSVRPLLPKSIVKRVGRWLAVVVLGAGSVLGVWMTLHDHFPDYVPIAQVVFAKSTDYAATLYNSIDWTFLDTTKNGLELQPFDYKYVSLPSGNYPLSAFPPNMTTSPSVSAEMPWT